MQKRCEQNPFFVLGLAPSASAEAVEREGRKLLMQLEAGVAAAAKYRTPYGERERTADLVRSALATLRDPDARLGHELWARALGAENPSAPEVEGWPEAFRSAGLRR